MQQRHHLGHLIMSPTPPSVSKEVMAPTVPQPQLVNRQCLHGIMDAHTNSGIDTGNPRHSQLAHVEGKNTRPSGYLTPLVERWQVAHSP
jgi:hypothetical protein